MIKRVLMILILCLALLFTACHTDAPQSTGETPLPSGSATAGSTAAATTEPPVTTEPHATTEPPATTEPSVATEPTETEPNLPRITADDWQPVYRPMDYDTFFGENHSIWQCSTTWYTPRGNGLTTAHVEWSGDILVIRSNGVIGDFPVPHSESLKGYKLYSADGVYAYLASETQIVRISLLKGTIDTLDSCDELHITANRHVMYYTAVEGDSVRMCRLYLPSGTVDILVDNIPLDKDNIPIFANCYDSQGKVSWFYDNPKLIEKLHAEVADPNSPYRETIDSILTYHDSLQLLTVPFLTHQIQEDCDIPAFVKETYDQKTKTVSKVYGRIDMCWYGSGYPHDHYDPNTYDIEPVWDSTEPVPLPNMVAHPGGQALYDTESVQQELNVSAFDAGDGRRLLYQCSGYIYTPIMDTPIRTYTVVGDMIFCITQDNVLLQILPGVSTHTLYTGKEGNLSHLSYNYGYLYFLDGTLMMEVDLPQQTIRQLIRFPHFGHYYAMGPRQLYVESYCGQSVDGYECDFAAMTYRSHYHL